jgi:hypothetical protein
VKGRGSIQGWVRGPNGERRKRNGKEQKGEEMAERLASANGDSKFVIPNYLLSFCDSKLAIQIEYSLLLIWNCQTAGHSFCSFVCQTVSTAILSLNSR